MSNGSSGIKKKMEILIRYSELQRDFPAGAICYRFYLKISRITEFRKAPLAGISCTS
jgi:hypothetical protein